MKSIKHLLLALTCISSPLLYAKLQDHKSPRKLEHEWIELSVWNREYLISACGDLPNMPHIEQKIAATLVELGEALLPYYGKKAGHDFTKLLQNQQILTQELVIAVLKKSDVEVVKKSEAWKLNSTKVSTFLAKLNPYLSAGLTRNLFSEIHASLLAMIQDRHQKKWKEELTAYDSYREKNLEFGQLCTKALENAFPKKSNPTVKVEYTPTPFGLPSDVTIATSKKS